MSAGFLLDTNVLIDVLRAPVGRHLWPNALPGDDTVVDASGQVAATILATGGTKEQLPIQVVDAHLTATAHAFDLEPVTSDLSNFQDVSGLIAVTPFAVTAPQEGSAVRSPPGPLPPSHRR